MADCDRHRLGDCTAVTARTSRLGAIGLSPRGEAAQLGLVEAIARAISPDSAQDQLADWERVSPAEAP